MILGLQITSDLVSNVCEINQKLKVKREVTCQQVS